MLKLITALANGVATSLSAMKVGHRGRIVGLLEGEKVYRQRLIAMGLLPGTEFVVSRIAPLGDPVEILVRGFALSLRKEEARILKIVGVNECSL